MNRKEFISHQKPPHNAARQSSSVTFHTDLIALRISYLYAYRYSIIVSSLGWCVFLVFLFYSLQFDKWICIEYVRYVISTRSMCGKIYHIYISIDTLCKFYTEQMQITIQGAALESTENLFFYKFRFSFLWWHSTPNVERYFFYSAKLLHCNRELLNWFQKKSTTPCNNHKQSF